MARRLLAVPLRVEHLPEGRRDGAHPRTHAEMQSALRATAARCWYRGTDKGSDCAGMNRCLLCMLVGSNKYCAVVNNSYSGGAFAPIYIPVHGEKRREKCKSEARGRGRWEARSGRQDWWGCTLMSTQETEIYSASIEKQLAPRPNRPL